VSVIPRNIRRAGANIRHPAPTPVIPAKTGISCGSCPALLPEIPAFAGMTA